MAAFFTVWSWRPDKSRGGMKSEPALAGELRWVGCVCSDGDAANTTLRPGTSAHGLLIGKEQGLMNLCGSRPGCSHSGGGSCSCSFCTHCQGLHIGWRRISLSFHGSEALGPLSTAHTHSECRPHPRSPRPSASHTPQKEENILDVILKIKKKNIKKT